MYTSPGIWHAGATLLLLIGAASQASNAATFTAASPFDVADASFEQAALNATNAPQGYVYGPSPEGTLYGSAWTFNPTNGIAKNGAAASLQPLDGVQSAFLQGAAYSLIKQYFTLPAGRYVVRVKASQKQLAGNVQKVFVRVDGVDRFNLQPPASSWGDFQSPAFDVSTTGTHQIELYGDPNTNLGQMGFIDTVHVVPANLISDGGFEQPPLPPTTPNKFVYGDESGIAGAVWTFSIGTGLALNDSAFNNGMAPEGSQVALVQGLNPEISQSFNVPVAGRFRLSLKARQRLIGGASDAQTIAIKIDGLDIGTVKPGAPDYTSYVFDAIKLSAGTHVLKFKGADDNSPGGHTAFIDDVSLVSVVGTARRWSDPGTWGSSNPPTANDDVVIPAGAIVLLDTSAVAKTVKVEGELHCADQNISLDTNQVLVTGRLVCGSPATPYEHSFVTTLYGEKGPDEKAGMGHKFIAAMSPGVIELHGRERDSWTQLSATAEVGATRIYLANAVNWAVGDIVVLAPTGAAPTAADVVTIQAISNGTVVDFAPPLEYRHFAATTTYQRPGSSPSYSWTLDERGEVGLLSRNIKIQGDPSSTSTAFGGHMMTMGGSTIHASSIELYRMGQAGILARYPFHWHLVGPAPGQYIKKSSIHDSYHRCVTVHGTHDTLVADNVCYNFGGHGFFLEDGIERNNVFDRNLGILGRKPGTGAVLPTDNRTATASNGPATFWISNPSNIFTRNVAAGFEGTGFWYHTESQVTGASAPASGFCATQPASDACINPKLQPFGLFADNRAHSGAQGFSSCENESGREGLDAANVLINNLTVTNVNQGVWPCASNMLAMNSTFENLIVANTPNGMQSPSPVTIRNSLFLAYSANEHPHAAVSAETEFGGIFIYDQGFLLDKVHFANYDRPMATAFYTSGGAHKWMNNRSQGLSFTPNTNIFSDLLSGTYWYPQSQSWSDVVHDLDGSLVGTGYALVADRPLTWDASCRRPAGTKMFGYGCPYHYAQITLKTSNPYDNEAEPVTVVRSDGAMLGGPGPIPDAFVSAFIANGGYRHAYRYDKGLTRTNVWLSVNNAMPGESTVHEILDVPTNFRLDPQTPGSAWVRRNTIGEFQSAPGHSYFYDTVRRSLLIKTAPTGVAWFATDTFWACLDGNNSIPPPPCSFGPRSFVPPTLTITSPDRAPATPQNNVTFNVNVVPSMSTKLFVDDEAGAVRLNGADITSSTTTSSHSMNLPAGRYLVRVVAYPNATESYSALQTLTVGEPVPRIAITSLVDNGTYFKNNLPALAYQVLGTAGPPQHIHWLVNGVDQGEAAAGSQTLSSLTQGRYDLQLAFANADHSLSPVGDKRTIYVVDNGVLADFEDGIDLRTSFTGSESMGYLYGRRQTGRQDAGEDGQRATTLPGTQTTFRLALQPAQDWTSWNQLKIYHVGPAYQVYLIYANGTAAALSPPGNAGMYMQDYFSLSTVQKTQIVAIELRQTASSGTCAPNPYTTTSCQQTQDIYYLQLLP